MRPDLIANQTILATVAMFVTAIGTLGNETTILEIVMSHSWAEPSNPPSRIITPRDSSN
jgi:hypothetical protein